jgi:prepilin-type N-terminal cleavage/methylation domain-containing protein
MPLKNFQFSIFNFQIRKKGFTLIELLVVISIIAILATIGFVNYQQAVKKGRDSRRMADLKVMQSGFEQYHSDVHFYPPSFGDGSFGSELNNCTGRTSCTTTKVYLKSTPKDPINGGINIYHYETVPSSCATTTCQGYCLYANVEDPTNASKPTECSNASYNYAVTRL